VNGGLARSVSPANRKVGWGGRPGETMSECPGCGGQRPQAGLRFQGGAISTIRRSAHPQGASVACPARSKATGAYEGSLLAEGVSGRGIGLFFTKRPQKWSWRLSGVEATQLARVAQRRVCEGALPSANRERRQKRQRFDRIVAVGRKCPRQLDGFPLVTLRCRSAEAVWVA